MYVLAFVAPLMVLASDLKCGLYIRGQVIENFNGPDCYKKFPTEVVRSIKGHSKVNFLFREENSQFSGRKLSRHNPLIEIVNPTVLALDKAARKITIPIRNCFAKGSDAFWCGLLGSKLKSYRHKVTLGTIWALEPVESARRHVNLFDAAIIVGMYGRESKESFPGVRVNAVTEVDDPTVGILHMMFEKNQVYPGIRSDCGFMSLDREIDPYSSPRTVNLTIKTFSPVHFTYGVFMCDVMDLNTRDREKLSLRIVGTEKTCVSDVNLSFTWVKSPDKRLRIDSNRVLSFRRGYQNSWFDNGEVTLYIIGPLPGQTMSWEATSST